MLRRLIRGLHICFDVIRKEMFPTNDISKEFLFFVMKKTNQKKAEINRKNLTGICKSNDYSNH